MGIRPQKIPSPDSQIAQNVLEQTETIFQDVRKNAMQAYIKYKAYSDKKANASKLRHADNIFLIQPEQITKEVNFFLQISAGPNNNYLVRKVGTNKTQILHRMRLRQFALHQPIPDIPITPREWQSDPEVVITHDDSYARAWECEYDEPIFDSDYNNLATPSPHETTIRSEQAADEISNTPGIIPGNSPKINPQPDGSNDGRTWITTRSLMCIRV